MSSPESSRAANGSRVHTAPANRYSPRVAVISSGRPLNDLYPALTESVGAPRPGQMRLLASRGYPRDSHLAGNLSNRAHNAVASLKRQCTVRRRARLRALLRCVFSPNGSAEMAGEEAGGIFTRPLWDACVAPQVGVEGLLRRSESVK